MTENQEDAAGPSEPVHGQLAYLQVPAIDVAQSATFYENVFGWHVEPPHPSFEAPGLIGQWVSECAEDLRALLRPPRGRLPSTSTLRPLGSDAASRFSSCVAFTIADSGFRSSCESMARNWSRRRTASRMSSSRSRRCSSPS